MSPLLVLAVGLVVVLAATLVVTAERPGFTRWTSVIIVTGIVTVVAAAALFVVMAIFAISDSDGTTLAHV